MCTEHYIEALEHGAHLYGGPDVLPLDYGALLKVKGGKWKREPST